MLKLLKVEKGNREYKRKLTIEFVACTNQIDNIYRLRRACFDPMTQTLFMPVFQALGWYFLKTFFILSVVTFV